MQKLSIIIVIFVVLIVAALVPVFNGDWILWQTLQLGPISVRYYGLTMALAVGAGWWLALRRARQYGMDEQGADQLLLCLVIGGFVGARLYHVASSWAYYLHNPGDIFKVWQGGLSIFGALIGGFIVLLGTRTVLRKKGLSLFRVLDWLAPGVLVGQIIGRFGNLFNYEAFGYPTTLPWKMFVPQNFRTESFAGSAFFHPLFLYEAVGNAIILFLLFYVAKPGKLFFFPKKIGALFFLYLILYNTLRFLIEFLRIDSTFFHTGLGSVRLNSISSALLAMAGLVGMYIVRESKLRIKDI